MNARVLLLAISLLALRAGGAEEPGPVNVRIDLRVIAVPMAEGLKIAPALRNAETFAAAEARVLAMLAGGKAELIDWLRAESPSGQKTTAESIDEVRYASDWNLQECLLSASSPFAQAIKDEREGLTPRERARRERTRAANVAGTSNLEAGEPTTPTAIETRSIGSTLEVEPDLAPDEDRIEISMALTLVRLESLGDKGASDLARPRQAPSPDPRAHDWQHGVTVPAQPRFSVLRLRTNFEMANGEGLLLTSEVQPLPRPRLLLFLLHASTQHLPP